MDVIPQIICELGFIHLKIAADKQYDIMVIGMTLINNRFAGSLFITMQEPTDVLNGMNVRSVYQDKFPGGIPSFVMDNTLCRLHIRTVITFRTDCNGILPCRSEQHEFMGNMTAHHTGIGSHRNDLRQSYPCIDALISLMTLFVIIF